MTPLENLSDSVSLNLLRRYLLAKGWRRVEGRRSKPEGSDRLSNPETEARALFQSRSGGKANIDLYVLSEPGSSDIELVIPQHSGGAEYESRLQGAIMTLSQLEDRKPDQIITAINSIGFDIVQSRIPSELVANETIYLETAQSYVNGMRDLLVATAMTEINPYAYFGRANNEAVDFADKCRFGHTYRGSFGFTIESPLNPNREETLFGLDPTPPFERRVVQRLATGIQQICDAVRADDITPLREGFRTGFSANGHERFASLIRNTAYIGMSFRFSFSPEWAVMQRLSQTLEFSVGPKHVDVAYAAASFLRGESREVPINIHGMVVRLQNEADPSDLSAPTGEGEISVLQATEDYGDIHVRIILPPADYLIAVEAHRRGQPVRLSGILSRSGRYWYIKKPSRVTISEQPNLGLQ